jgi:methionine synthase II (cobalamin-independent)
MFATLLGGLPRPPLPDPDRPPSPTARLDVLVGRVIEAQESAGIELVTDGRLRWSGFTGPIAGLAGVVPGGRADGPRLAPGVAPSWAGPLTVDAWAFAASATSRPVKQALPGPYSLGRRLAESSGIDRPSLTMALATALRSEIQALAAAGCAVVEIEERDATEIGEDDAERRLFREAHLALIEGLESVHLSLAIVGGNADTAGIETILAAPYSSLAVDLIDGPDNWRLVRGAPGDRGIVAGALSPRHPSDDGPELLIWAAGYAASSNGRGPERVGLATAGSLAGLSWEHAERKLRRLGEAARLATLPAAEAAPHLDPRAIDIRSAAAGRYVPKPPRRGPRPARPPRGTRRP